MLLSRGAPCRCRAPALHLAVTPVFCYILAPLIINRPVGILSSMAAPRRLQDRAELTRKRIIDAAASAFAADGYDRVTLNSLIEASGVSKGAFYFHFSSKEELALAAFLAKQDELLERLEPADQPPDLPAWEQLAGMLRRRNRLLADDRSLACVTRLGNEMSARSVPGSPYAVAQEVVISLIARVVEAGQRRGEFRPELDPHAVAWAIFAWVVGVDAMVLAIPGGMDLAERSEQMLVLLRRALLVKPDAAQGHPEGAPSTNRARDHRAARRGMRADSGGAHDQQ